MPRLASFRTLAVIAVTAIALATPTTAHAAKGGQSEDHRQDTNHGGNSAGHRQDGAHGHKGKSKSKPAKPAPKGKAKGHHKPSDQAAGGGVVQH